MATSEDRSDGPRTTASRVAGVWTSLDRGWQAAVLGALVIVGHLLVQAT